MTFKIQNAQSNYESKIVSYKRKNNKDAAIPKHPLDKDNKKSGNQSDSGIDRLVGLATTGDTYGGGGGAYTGSGAAGGSGIVIIRYKFQ